jgi:hypothetical protein
MSGANVKMIVADQKVSENLVQPKNATVAYYILHF